MYYRKYKLFINKHDKDQKYAKDLGIVSKSEIQKMQCGISICTLVNQKIMNLLGFQKEIIIIQID